MLGKKKWVKINLRPKVEVANYPSFDENMAKQWPKLFGQLGQRIGLLTRGSRCDVVGMRSVKVCPLVNKCAEIWIIILICMYNGFYFKTLFLTDFS